MAHTLRAVGKRIWINGRRARAGVLVALVGLVLLAATLALRVDADDPSCASLNPERARECVAERAQSLDRNRSLSMLAIAGAVTLVAIGGAVVLRARRRVLEVAAAAELLGTDVRGVRSLIANRDLMSITSDGRTYVDAVEIERMARAANASNGMPTPGPA